MALPTQKFGTLVRRGPVNRHYDRMKRTFDLFIAFAAIVAILPLLITIAMLIRASGPGPILYKQRRLGRGGREFWCLKFRTMVANADEVLRSNPKLFQEFQANFKIKDDPRITPIGRFLRRTSLDELPQFFNVMAGDMSLIGPRPIVQNELEKYGPYADRLLSVLPGLGGVWQTSGRSEVDYSERVAMDMFYIENRSFYLDFKLLLLTALAVLKRDGAC
ncbi:MAG: sugar transferase [Armatimonadota bacterium]